MKKLQLSLGDGPIHNGYELHVVDNKSGTMFSDKYLSIADNSYDEIIAFDFISRFNFDKIDYLFKNIVSKLRLNGKFSFDFLNYSSLDVVNMTGEEFNSKIYRCNSSFCFGDIYEYLEKYRLKVITTDTDDNSNITTVTIERL